jgi:uncharacterized protein with NAD-binding domain and iron-sulfur cluster
VRTLFPSARGLKVQWHSIVKIGQSLYREAPGMDPFRPDQATPIPNFFLAGSYTKQVGPPGVGGGGGCGLGSLAGFGGRCAAAAPWGLPSHPTPRPTS